ncbi:MAG: hypothetical protein NVS2B16_29770 [Chloroflexota bacterium]
MNERFRALFQKEVRQITRSKKTTIAAALVPALMLIFVTTGDIITLKLGFGSKPIYLLSPSHPVSGSYLLRHYSLPVLITISALVTPSIVMADVLLGERERRTFDLLVALPISTLDMILAKLAAVLVFAIVVTVPLFVLNQAILAVFGYGSPPQTTALAGLLVAGIAYSSAGALLIALIAGEPRAANIVSGLVMGPVVPFEGLILSAMHGVTGISACASVLVVLTVGAIFWSTRMLSWERLAGA